MNEDDSRGRVPQIVYLVPSFHFMQSKTNVLKNDQKVPFFLHQIKTKA